MLSTHDIERMECFHAFLLKAAQRADEGTELKALWELIGTLEEFLDYEDNINGAYDRRG